MFLETNKYLATVCKAACLATALILTANVAQSESLIQPTQPDTQTQIKQFLTPHEVFVIRVQRQELIDRLIVAETELYKNSLKKGLLEEWVRTGVRPDLLNNKIIPSSKNTLIGTAGGAILTKTSIKLIEKYYPHLFEMLSARGIAYVKNNPLVAGALIGTAILAYYNFKDIKDYDTSLKEILSSIEELSSVMSDNSKQLAINSYNNKVKLESNKLPNVISSNINAKDETTVLDGTTEDNSTPIDQNDPNKQPKTKDNSKVVKKTISPTELLKFIDEQYDVLNEEVANIHVIINQLDQVLAKY
ncbi:MAG: hypothetical protein ABL927_00095 [Bdellovibrionales bacterium]